MEGITKDTTGNFPRKYPDLEKFRSKKVETAMRETGVDKTIGHELILVLTIKVMSLLGAKDADARANFDSALWEDTQVRKALQTAFADALKTGLDRGRQYPYSQPTERTLQIQAGDTQYLQSAIEQAFSEPQNILPEEAQGAPSASVLRSSVTTNEAVQKVADVVTKWLNWVKNSASNREASYNKTRLPVER